MKQTKTGSGCEPVATAKEISFPAGDLGKSEPRSQVIGGGHCSLALCNMAVLDGDCRGFKGTSSLVGQFEVITFFSFFTLIPCVFIRSLMPSVKICIVNSH